MFLHKDAYLCGNIKLGDDSFEFLDCNVSLQPPASIPKVLVPSYFSKTALRTSFTSIILN